MRLRVKVKQEVMNHGGETVDANIHGDHDDNTSRQQHMRHTNTQWLRRRHDTRLQCTSCHVATGGSICSRHEELRTRQDAPEMEMYVSQHHNTQTYPHPHTQTRTEQVASIAASVKRERHAANRLGPRSVRRRSSKRERTRSRTWHASFGSFVELTLSQIRFIFVSNLARFNDLVSLHLVRVCPIHA